MAMIRGTFAKKVVATKIVAEDGSGDFVNIQDAINDLPAGGGVVYIREGTYTITVPIEVNKDNVALIGAGKSTKIQTTGDITMINVPGRTGIIVRNVYLYGSGPTSLNNYGIYFYTTTFSVIDSCWAENCGAGIIFDESSNDCGANNNHCASNNVGMSIARSNRSIFYGNVSNSNTYQGIYYLWCINCMMIGNAAFSNGGDGIVLEGCEECVVIGNEFRDNDVNNTATYNGIYLCLGSDRNIIALNRCQDNDNYEIKIGMGPPLPADENNNLILGNNCLGDDHEGTISDDGIDTVMGFNIITTTDVDLKGNFRLPQGGSWVLKDYRGFTIFEVKEDGIYIKGKQVKT